MPDPSIQDLIRQEAQKAGVPPELALSVAEQESSFNPTAVNPKTQATGVFQFIPKTAQDRGIDPTDPVQNIRGGVSYLRELLDRHQGNLENVLKEYGGVKTDQTYVPSVLAKVAKYQAAPPAPSVTQPQAAPSNEPRGRSAAAIGMAQMMGLDPRTSQGQKNLAGMGAATAANAALTTIFPEIGLPANAALWGARALRTMTPIVGAYLGGAGAQGAQDVAAGGPPKPSAMMEAGGQQARVEAGGQLAGHAISAIGRRVMAAPISKRISQGLSDALDTVNATLKAKRPAVSPAQAGEMFTDVAQGPAKAVKDQLGQNVEQAAASGPMVPTQPLKDRLVELSKQVTPLASHAQVPSLPGYTPAQVQALAVRNPQILSLPVDHPLPGALAQIEEAIGGLDEIPFEDAHKIKVLLDSAVNWDKTAKKPAEQITKGFRQTLRQVMASHPPYEQATAAYAPVAKLYQDVGADRLHAAIRKNPGMVVQKVNWQNPASIQLVKDLTELPTGTGAQEGEAAFHAVRAAWTNEQLIAKGPIRMANEIDRIEASNAGKEFVQTMYGDPAGQAQWENLKQIAAALRQAQGNIKAFADTTLARATEPSGVVRDIGLSIMPHHTIGKIGAVSRLVFGKGTAAGPMIEWASRTPATTQFLIKHVLTGPNPGMALADMTRWFMENQTPMPSHEQTGPPPPPHSLAR